MDKCFVIQPFDRGVFDKRYNDIFEDAIIEAGLEPYRVDKDLTVRVPIENIERGIENSKICFAEITTNNPNVWYELGYAFACKKDVVLVCNTKERNGKYPFDIQHRQIITYENSSSSDFDKLKKTITSKIKALLSKQQKIETLIDNPVKESQGLKQHEVTLLIMLTSQQLTDIYSVPVYELRNDMEKAGFTTAAVGLSIRGLRKHGLIEVVKEVDFNGEEYPACKLTKDGETWILENQDKIQLRKEDESETTAQIDPDTIPF